MKYIFLTLAVMISFSACSVKKSSMTEKEYQRSNTASEKAFDRLDRE